MVEYFIWCAKRFDPGTYSIFFNNDMPKVAALVS